MDYSNQTTSSVALAVPDGPLVAGPPKAAGLAETDTFGGFNCRSLAFIWAAANANANAVRGLIQKFPS